MAQPQFTALNRLTKLYASNVTASSFTAAAPTATEPTGDGVFGANVEGLLGANDAALVFYGTRTAADNETFTARVNGWRQVSTDLWVPVPLLALTLTQGTATGVSGKSVVNTEYFVDTITASTAYTSAYEIISPADNTVACVKVDFFGCGYLSVQLARGTDASCNVLLAAF